MERDESTPGQVEPEPQPAPPEPKPDRGYRGTGIWISVVGAVLVATAFLVFVAQNTEKVRVQWTVWDVDVSLAAVVFGAMLLGSALTLAIGAIWRIRHRRRLREREELHRLRAGQG